MRKLKLNLDRLDVSSFDTHAGDAARGTVDARLNETASGPHITCDAHMETCAYTCHCGPTGVGTCNGDVCV